MSKDTRFEVVMIKYGKMHQVLLSQEQIDMFYEMLNLTSEVKFIKQPICEVNLEEVKSDIPQQ